MMWNRSAIGASPNLRSLEYGPQSQGGEQPGVLARLRERGVTEYASRYVIGVLFGLQCQNFLAEFWRTGHLTGLLFLASESLVVIFTLLRRRASVVDGSPFAVAVTTLSVFGPWLLRAHGAAPLLPDAVTAAITVAGVSLVVVSKLTLGRSFGLMPANRGVIVRGPYSVVRHPIYTGYWIIHTALILAHPEPLNFLAVFLADGATVIRALREERVLCKDAVYREHCARVRWHFVPGVF
jgi:protein-S-isoprenylcysteine O-methyltransferase Ste14